MDGSTNARADGVGGRAAVAARRRPGLILLGVACALVTVLLLAAQLDVGLTSAGRRVGMAVREAPTGGLEVMDVLSGSPAERAGVRAGDLLLQVEGLPVGASAEYQRVALGFHSGVSVDMLFRRGGEVERLTVTPGLPFAWRDYLLSAVTSLCFLGVGMLALLQRSDDLRARLLFLFSTAVAVELAMPTGVIGYPALSVARSVAFFLLTGLQIGVELHLASVIPQPQRWLERHRLAVALFYTAGAAVGIGGAGAFVAEGVLRTRMLPWTSQQAETLLNDVGVPVWAVAIVILLAIPALRFPELWGRQQARRVLLGALPWAAIVGWTAVSGLLGKTPPGWADSLWAPLLLCYPAAVFVAVYRFNLFDLEFVVRRSLIYGALTGTLVLVFYAVLGAASAVVSRAVSGGRASVWIVAGATLVLGLLFAPLRRVVQKTIDRTVFPERESRHRRLTALAQELPAQGKVPGMGRYLVAELRDIFALRRATLLLADPRSDVLVGIASSPPVAVPDHEPSVVVSSDDPGLELLRRAGRPVAAAQVQTKSPALRHRLDHLGAAFVVPLLAHERLVGVLVIGEKAVGPRFPAEELELLNLFSHNVAAVLENARLFESATYESLTGFLRRDAVLEQLERELERARRYGRPLTVGMADLDDFKAINDSHGHLVGDTVLAGVARALAAGLRSSDAIGRYGGDEFLLVLPETDLDGAAAVADKLRGLVEAVRIDADAGSVVRVTLSIGLAAVVELDRPDHPSVEGIIALADRRLFAAKQRGRNRVEPPPAAEPAALLSY